MSRSSGGTVGPYAPGTTVKAYLATNANLTAATPAALTSVALVAGTWLVTYFGIVEPGALNGDADLWIGPTSAVVAGGYSGQSILASVAAGWSSVAGAYSLVLASAGTVYLNVQSSGAGTVYAASVYQSVPNATGLVAVRTA